MRALRTTLAYLTKFPRAALDIFPSLRDVVDSISGPGPLEKWDPEDRQLDVPPAVIPATGLGTHSTDSYEAREIDLAISYYAIDSAVMCFEEDGWAIDFPQTAEVYDFVARKNDEERYVFTLGTTDDGNDCTVSQGVIDHLREHPNSALVLTPHLDVTRYFSHGVLPTTDTYEMIDPWTLEMDG